MPTVSIPELGKIGLVVDRYPHEIPLNAYNDCNNVRFRNGFVEKILGEAAYLGTPLHAPYNVGQCQYLDEKFWLYPGLAAVGAIDSTGTHGNIDGPSAPYSATIDENWTITNFQGIPVINNPNDLPQAWLPPLSLGQVLADLPNWPAATFAKSMRAYRQFLVALNIRKPGDVYPRMVKWSHPAAASSVPSSWDETDTTKDAGEYELSDTDGYAIDGLPLRDTFVIYKQDSIWGMQYVGGAKVMRFFKMFDGLGILGPRCITEFFVGKHLVMGTDDIFIHDGQQRQSILDDKMRRAFYSRVNPDTFPRSFVVIDYNFQEVWCCAPQGTSALCNVALIWNWKDNTLSLRDLPDVAGGTNGVVPVPASQIWDGDPDTWDSDTTVWDDLLYNPLSRRIVFARPDPENLILADDTLQYEGVSYEAYVERSGIGIPFRANQPPDTSSMKLWTALWPRIEGTNGGELTIEVGYQMEQNGDITWQAPITYTIGTTKQVPIRVSGRLFAYKISSESAIDWRLHGMDMDVKQIGRF